VRKLADSDQHAGWWFGWLGKIPSTLRRLQNGGWQQNQMSLFEWTDTSEEDWTLEQKVNAQLEIFEASLDAHLLKLVSEKIIAAGTTTTLEAAERIGRRVTFAGVRQTSHCSRTAKGNSMLFLTLEDLDGTLDAIPFPEVYRVAQSLFDSSKPFLISGVMEMDTERGEPFLKAENVVLVG
jgi:DNA polymerase III alpha subunit